MAAMYAMWTLATVVEFLLQIRHHTRHTRERIEARAVAADNRIFADEPSFGLQVCEHDSHQSPQSDAAARNELTHARYPRPLISIRRIDDKGAC